MRTAGQREPGGADGVRARRGNPVVGVIVRVHAQRAMASSSRRFWQDLRRWFTGRRLADEAEDADGWSFTDEYPYYVDPPPHEELKLDLTEPLELTPRLLRELEWQRLEELVGAMYRVMGMDAQAAHRSVIGGPNLYLYQPGEHRPHGCVVCCPLLETRWLIRRARDLVAALAAEDIRLGVFVAAGPIPDMVRRESGAAEIEWVDGSALIERFATLRVEDRDRILRRVTRGDYRTPTCPSCQVKMVLVATAERTQWRCANFPRCQRQMTARSRD